MHAPVQLGTPNPLASWCTSWTSYPVGVFLWTRELLSLFTRIIQPVPPVAKPWLVRLVSLFCARGKSSSSCPSKARCSIGLFSWLQSNSPSLGWIFCTTLGSWWTQHVTSWWTAPQGSPYTASLQRLGTAFTWHGVFSGLLFPFSRVTNSQPPQQVRPILTDLFSPVSTQVHRPLRFPLASP